MMPLISAGSTLKRPAARCTCGCAWRIRWASAGVQLPRETISASLDGWLRSALVAGLCEHAAAKEAHKQERRAMTRLWRLQALIGGG
jgi:hypothetical protein